MRGWRIHRVFAMCAMRSYRHSAMGLEKRSMARNAESSRYCRATCTGLSWPRVSAVTDTRSLDRPEVTFAGLPPSKAADRGARDYGATSVSYRPGRSNSDMRANSGRVVKTGFFDRGPLSCSKSSYRRLIIEWKVDLQVFTKGCIIPTSLFDLKPTRSGSEGLRFRRATRAVTTASRVPFSLDGDGERG